MLLKFSIEKILCEGGRRVSIPDISVIYFSRGEINIVYIFPVRNISEVMNQMIRSSQLVKQIKSLILQIICDLILLAMAIL